METLAQIWKRLYDQGYETDKGSIHSYIPVYEKLLEPYRETALNVLEIGIFKGDSIRMWADYFTKATIHGVDCSFAPHNGLASLQRISNDIYSGKMGNTVLHIFDAENVEEVSKRFFGTKFDVIIEDAGHDINQQLNLYRIWSQYLAKDGIYIIEDVQDFDKDFIKFTELNGYADYYDKRHIKNRYDDVLIVLK